MRVGIVRETAPGERRVALVPETVGKLTAAGFDVVVEPGAGVADQVAAGPGSDAIAAVPPAATVPADGTLDFPTSNGLPRIGVANLVSRAPASLAAVLALLLAALLFLVLHPALDRHDGRLAVAGVDDVARFR